MSGPAAITGFRERFGEPADTPALVTLINVAFLPEQVAIEGDRINAEKLQPFFANGKFLLLEDAHGVAGCVYAEVRGQRGYIGLLALRPQLKGRGLGGLRTNGRRKQSCCTKKPKNDKIGHAPEYDCVSLERKSLISTAAEPESPED